MTRIVLASAFFVVLSACVQSEESKPPATTTAKLPGRSSEAADSSSAAPRVATVRQPEAAAANSQDICALLTSKEVMDVTGLAIERTEKTEDGCEWYASAAAQQQKGMRTARATFDQLTKKDPKSAEDGVKTMENLMKSVGGAVAPDKPLFAVTINRHDVDAGEAMLRGTISANGGVLEPIEGLGDRAFIGAMGMLFYVRKGNALITIGGMGTREQTIALARVIVPRM